MQLKTGVLFQSSSLRIPMALINQGDDAITSNGKHDHQPVRNIRLSAKLNSVPSRVQRIEAIYNY